MNLTSSRSNLLLSAKLFFFAFILMVSSSKATSQNLQDDVFLGLGITYGERIDVLGIQGNLAFMVRDDARVAVDLTHFFTYDRELIALGNVFNYQQSSWELNFNGHYFLFNSENAALYVLMGLHYGRTTNSISDEERLGVPVGEIPGFPSDRTGVGANIGGGMEFILNAVGIFIEAKNTFGGSEQFSVSSGFRLRF